MSQVPPEIFKAYDIRGIVERHAHGRDGRADRPGDRLRSPRRGRSTRDRDRSRRTALRSRACAGAGAGHLRASGVDVIDIGMVPTPMVYFAAYHLGTGCACRGHRQPQSARLQRAEDGARAATTLARRCDPGAARPHRARRFRERRGQATRDVDVTEAYLERIAGDVKLARPMKIVVDCGNGVAGATRRRSYRRLGCEVIELFCDVDGTFPNHHPDPTKPREPAGRDPRSLGHRCGDRARVRRRRRPPRAWSRKDGEIIYPDRQLMLFADDVLDASPAPRSSTT